MGTMDVRNARAHAVLHAMAIQPHQHVLHVAMAVVVIAKTTLPRLHAQIVHNSALLNVGIRLPKVAQIAQIDAVPVVVTTVTTNVPMAVERVVILHVAANVKANVGVGVWWNVWVMAKIQVAQLAAGLVRVLVMKTVRSIVIARVRV